MENIITIEKISPYYPQNFLKIENPPEKIYAIGNIELLNTFNVAIVGARACSDESIILTQKLSEELSLKGITIISGMAPRHRSSCT